MLLYIYIYYLKQGKLPHFLLFMHITCDIDSKLNVTALIHKLTYEYNPVQSSLLLFQRGCYVCNMELRRSQPEEVSAGNLMGCPPASQLSWP